MEDESHLGQCSEGVLHGYALAYLPLESPTQPLLHIHSSDSLKFSLFFQLNMGPNKHFSLLLQDLRDFGILLMSLSASCPSAFLIWKLLGGGTGLELDSSAATLVG